MVKFKNVRPGVLLITDAGIRLSPGQTVEVETPSKDTEKALAAGLLAMVRAKGDPPLEISGMDPPDPPMKDTVPKAKAKKTPAKPKDSPFVEDDQALIDNMAKRLEEVDGGSG